MEGLKYFVNSTYFGLDVWTKDGKIAISESTSQKDLQALADLGHPAAVAIEKPVKK